MSEFLPGVEHLPLVHFIARLVGREEAEDVVQQAYVKALSKQDLFRHESSYKTWVYTIAKRCALDVLRRRRRQPCLETVEEITLLYPHDPHTSLDVEEAQAALAQLSQHHREVIHALSVHETYHDAAAALNIRPTTFRSRVRRARQALRRRRAS